MPKSEASVSSDHKILLGFGVHCDHITNVEQQLETTNLRSYVKRKVESGAEDAYPTGVTIFEALFRTLLLDLDLMNSNRFEWRSIESLGLSIQFLSMLDMLPPGDEIDEWAVLLHELGFDDDDDPTSVFSDLMSESFDENLQNAAKTRITMGAVHALDDLRFFDTEEGYIGLAPPGTQAGDLVIVVGECRVPLILREVESHFIHIGHALCLD